MDISFLIDTFSYFGFFLIGFFSTFGLFISPPLYLFIPIILTMKKFNLILVTILTALGMSVGDCIGYLIGYSGEKVLEKKLIKKEKYIKFSKFLDKYGHIIIPILAAIPFPFFDTVAILYGFAKSDIKNFFLYLFIGRLIKIAFIILGGLYVMSILPFEI
ncbi:MAG: VTT domain-containing protein [Nanopusillaceae archaeon]